MNRDARVEAAAEALARLHYPAEPDIWSGNSPSGLTVVGRENYRAQVRYLFNEADKVDPAPATPEQRIGAVADAIAKRMSWASIHWGKLAPEAYPALAAVAVAAADAAAHTQEVAR